jgi:hypothetical protein
VGIVLLEMLTGRKPFEGADAYAILELQRDQRPPRLRDRVPGLSAELESVVAKALEKHPDKRFQTAAEFVTAIEVTPEWQGSSSAERERKRDSYRPGKPAQSPSASDETVSSAGVERAPERSVPERKPRRGFGGTFVLLLLTVGAYGWWKLDVGQLLPFTGFLGEKEPAPAAAAARVVEVRAGEPSAAAAPAGQAPSAPEQAAPAEPEVAAPVDPAGAAAQETAAAIIGEVAAALGLEEQAAPSDAVSDAGELSEAALAAADQALNDTEEREVKLLPPASPSEAKVETLAQVRALIAKGKLDAAIRGIQQLRRKTPRAAQLPFMLGNLYFDKHWWSDGLAKYREAIKLAPGYRGNGRIQRDAIRALGEDRTYPRARALLVRDIRRSAASALRRAAHNDPSKDVRRRAASILRQITR